MPYADGPHAMWSGYFTSRPALKGYVRDTSSVFQASKQLQFFAAPPADMSPTNPLFRLERAMGVTQHHDGVSGTSKQAVAYDYARRLAWGREDAAAANAAALRALTGFAAGAFATCDLANATICPALQAASAPNTTVMVTVYNQESRLQPAQNVRLPVALPTGVVASYAVQDAGGAQVVAQLVPASAADLELRTVYYGEPAPAPLAWLCFQAPRVPALGFSSLFVTAKATAAEAPLTHISVGARLATSGGGGLRLADSTLTNGIVTLTISAATGMLSAFANSRTNISVPLAQTFFYYNSSIGSDAPNDLSSDHSQASGAYILRTNSSTAFPVAAGPASVTVFEGPVVSVAQQSVAGWLSQSVMLWAGEQHAEIEMTVGPIPNGPRPTGKEVVVRYDAPALRTNATFFTDSNVREYYERRRNFRPSWPYTPVEPIAGNYYPVNSRIFARDEASGTTLSVTTDRTQGGSSIVDGSVELMVHRRLQQDDGRGVGEPINEPGLNQLGAGLVIRATHRLSVDAAASAPAHGKRSVQESMFRPLVALSGLAPGETPQSWARVHRANFSGLAAALPDNLHLLTVHALGPASVLVRLAHLFEKGEDPVLSLPTTVSLSTLFSGARLSGCVEMTVPASQPLAAVRVRTVEVEGEGQSTYPTVPPPPAGPTQDVVVSAMEVRSFMCSFA